MMPSEPAGSFRKRAAREAYVWVWLPNQVEPIVAGRLAADGERLIFNYGRSYLSREGAPALYEPELPLRAGALPLLEGLSMPGCLRDAAPDAWGRRVLLNRLLGAKGARADPAQLDELTYLLESGSDRAGALDFQASATEYEPRGMGDATLTQLQESARWVERGMPLSPELAAAIQHGTAIGGARPKALIDDEQRKWIAKFSSSTDLYSVVKAEFIAMRLARAVGLNVAQVELTRAAGRDVLLVQRFDRDWSAAGWRRHSMFSALTILGLDEMMARYASYEDLASSIRHRFTAPQETLRELFSRLVFNILCGNTDDHARNHAAFWDGARLTLTPGYDICPQSRTGNEASQAMLIFGPDRLSRISTCLDATHQFLLTRTQGLEIAERQGALIREHWKPVCDEARLSKTDRTLLASRAFLNPFSIEGTDIARLI